MPKGKKWNSQAGGSQKKHQQRKNLANSKKLASTNHEGNQVRSPRARLATSSSSKKLDELVSESRRNSLPKLDVSNHSQSSTSRLVTPAWKGNKTFNRIMSQSPHGFVPPPFPFPSLSSSSSSSSSSSLDEPESDKHEKGEKEKTKSKPQLAQEFSSPENNSAVPPAQPAPLKLRRASFGSLEEKMSFNSMAPPPLSSSSSSSITTTSPTMRSNASSPSVAHSNTNSGQPSPLALQPMKDAAPKESLSFASVGGRSLRDEINARRSQSQPRSRSNSYRGRQDSETMTDDAPPTVEQLKFNFKAPEKKEVVREEKSSLHPMPVTEKKTVAERKTVATPVKVMTRVPSQAKVEGSAAAKKAGDNVPVRIASFMELSQYAGAGALPRFIGLDIDETLIQTKSAPSLLLSMPGVQAFQQYVNRKYGNDFQTKNRLCRDIEACLKTKVLTEPCVAHVIRSLQDAGSWVFAVTARYSELADNTDKTLASLGINFASSSPFPAQMIKDPVTEAVCRNGIIYCNNQNKGLIVNRIFEHVVLRNVLKTQAETGKISFPCPPNTGGAPHRNASPPAGFVFVDDALGYAETFHTELKLAKQLNLPVAVYHYTPTERTAEEEKEKLATPQERGRLLMRQMDEFIAKRVLLSNKEAREMETAKAESSMVQ